MPSQVEHRSPRIAQPWVLKDLPPFHPVALKLLQLTARDSVHIGKIQSVLRTDVAFSAEVLRLANSALIGSRSEVRSLDHAIVMLGLERLKALSMTIAMRSFLSTAKSQEAMQLCWRYNLSAAIISEWLAPFVSLDPDTCYTAGLMHDIGRLAILRAYPDEYMRMVSAIEEYQFDLLRCEKDLFDINHCEAGLWLMDRWEFPAELRDIAEHHHDVPVELSSALLKVVHVAWQIADMLGYSPIGTRSDDTIEEITATLPEASRQRIFSKLDELPDLVTAKLGAWDSTSA
jgi:HD-like signal output (HDOD) protein